jgi:hypothetical protein
MTGDDDRLIARARAALDAEVAALDAGTRRRLAEARRAALASATRSGGGWRWAWTGAAFAASLAVVIGLGWQQAERSSLPPVAADDAAVIDWLAAGDSLELAADADFLAWIDDAALGDAG